VKDLFTPPALVRPAEDLGALLAAARAEHEAGEGATRKGLEHYRKAGEALVRAKAAAGHGQWLAALARTGIPQQRASEYMRLAAGWGKLPPGGSFALKDALQLIEAAAGQQGWGEAPPRVAPGEEEEVLCSVLGDGKEIALTLPRGGAGLRLTGAGVQFFGVFDFREWVLLGRGLASVVKEVLARAKVPERKDRHGMTDKEVADLFVHAPRELDAFLDRCEALADAEEGRLTT
jgi:hypothetical protein